MVEQQEFQIPQQLRELAEKNVEQARVAYGQFLDGMAEAVRAWSTVPSAVMTSGFKVVQERAIQFAKENAPQGARGRCQRWPPPRYARARQWPKGCDPTRRTIPLCALY